jgi:plasmid stabilization system protein ParE
MAHGETGTFRYLGVSGTAAGEDEPQTYRADISDTADLEADAIFLWLNRNRGPEQADRWYRGLIAAFESLTLFLHRYESVPAQSQVRRMLYGLYRVLYRIIEPAASDDVPTVRILRSIHGARNTS